VLTMTPTFLYKGYRLTPTTTRDADGTYQARIAIVTLSGDRRGRSASSISSCSTIAPRRTSGR